MHYHQWQVFNLGKPAQKPPHQVRIRIKATGEVITASSYGAGWLTPNGTMYTRHNAKFIGRVEDAKEATK